MYRNIDNFNILGFCFAAKHGKKSATYLTQYWWNNQLNVSRCFNIVFVTVIFTNVRSMLTKGTSHSKNE